MRAGSVDETAIRRATIRIHDINWAHQWNERELSRETIDGNTYVTIEAVTIYCLTRGDASGNLFPLELRSLFQIKQWVQYLRDNDSGVMGINLDPKRIHFESNVQRARWQSR